MLIFKVLGPVGLSGLTDLSHPVIAAKPRALLAALLLRSNQWVQTSFLIDVLWERPPRSARGNLRTYVWQLRSLLMAATGLSRLDGRLGWYRLTVRQGELDLHVFSELVQRAHHALTDGQADVAVEAVTTALLLWQGDPFEDVPTALVAPEIVALREQRWAALECLAEARLMLGQAQQAIAELRPTLAEQPFRERMWILYMRALAQVGRRADALAAYRDVCRQLSDELGLEPGPQLSAAHRLILTGHLA